MFDSDGKKIQVTPKFIREAQRFYEEALLKQADEKRRALFAQKQKRLFEWLFSDQHWDNRSELYVNSALIEWLIKEVQPANAGELSGKIKLLQRRLTSPSFQIDPSVNINTDTPFELPQALKDLLTEEGLAGSSSEGGMALSSTTELPQALKDLLTEEGLAGSSSEGGMALSSTTLGGADYVSECNAAGVPTPPDWGTNKWKNKGPLTIDFVGSTPVAEVFVYESTLPPGMCIALPRSTGNTISLLGIICLGKASGNACFWDNQQNNQGFEIQKGTVIPLSQFAGGADLASGDGGTCTDCHAGENPFIIHPNTALGLPNLSGLPLRADKWYTPLVHPKWPQNAGLTNILDSVSSPGQCTACHTQTGGGGRFPRLSTEIPGYCRTILPSAIGQTMPPGSPGSADYGPHTAALTAACKEPPTPSLTSPRMPALAAVNAVSRSNDKLDIFATDVNGTIWTAAWEPAFTDGWHGWWPLKGGAAAPGTPVTAVSRSPDKLDAFVTGTGGRVWTAAWEPSFTDWWHGWWPLNGGVAAPGAPVTVVSRGPDKLDVFVVGTDGRVWTAAWEPSFTDWWHGWWPIGDIRVPQGSAVHAVSRSPDKLDIFATDVNGTIWTAAWEPSFTDGWHGWWPLNGGVAAPGAPVTVVSRGPDKLDVFVVGTDGRVWTAAWEPSFTDWWHGWWPIGDVRVPQGSAIHAVSRSPDKLDIFATDVNGTIWTAAWESSFTDWWHGWWPLNGGVAAPGAPVTVVSRSPDKLDVFVVGTDGRVWTAAWEPSFTDWWHGWWPIGQ